MAKKTPTQATDGYEMALKLLPECDSIRDACRRADVKPSPFLLWVDKDEARKLQFARAREAMVDNYAASTEDIFDEQPERITIDQKIDPAWVQFKRAKVEYRKWHLSKLAPKVYGDKLELAGDASAPLVTRVEIVSVACKPQE